MSQSQKIISCLLSIAVIFGIMLTITCMAVEDSSNPQNSSSVVESSPEEEETSSEGEDTSSEDENSETEESSDGEESSQGEESEVVEESSEEEQQESGNNYYYSGDVSYPPYTGSRVLKNPNIVEEESKVEEKEDEPVEKDINDLSYVARRWIFLPVIFTILSLGGLIWFNLYVKKQNGKTKKRNARRERAEGKSEKNGRNFDRPKH